MKMSNNNILPKKDLIIIGAGLSGLYAATLLKDEFNIIILEARKRCGGRILTHEGHDLGPSWIWPHQKNILKLIHELDLEIFSQYTKGKALYDVPSGIQQFDPPPSAPSARVQGGLEPLIQRLLSQLPPKSIYLDQEVKQISLENSRLAVETSSGKYKADYVISTMPPRLASDNILYHPPLHHQTKQMLQQTPTWMGHTAKCVIEFSQAFWKDAGLSGFVFSHLGPLGEIHDASTAQTPALFGFLHSNASTKTINEDVKEQMQRLFGDKSELITKIHFIDWRKEKYSSTPHDQNGPSAHPVYGLDLSHFDNRLFFIGTETSYDNGGYLEGAVNSAQEIAKRLRSIVL